MKANTYKYHLLSSSNEESSVCIDNNFVKNSKCEKLLGVKIDQKLNFSVLINDICTKSRTKTKSVVQNYAIYGYSKEAPFTFTKCLQLQPLVWMCHKRSKNNKINHKSTS